MAVTILERLRDVKPNGKKFHVKNESLQVIYDLIRKHMAEIEEAIERGYSWKQIDDACRESWQEYGKAASSIVWWKDGHLVESCYRAVKKNASVGKGTKAKKAPLSLEVTVTKR